MLSGLSASLLQLLVLSFVCFLSTILTFSAHMPIESPVLSKASVALRALKRFLSGVMADMSHQRTFLPEASQAELANIRFLITMSPLMNLQGILSNTKTHLRH